MLRKVGNSIFHRSQMIQQINSNMQIEAVRRSNLLISSCAVQAVKMASVMLYAWAIYCYVQSCVSDTSTEHAWICLLIWKLWGNHYMLFVRQFGERQLSHTVMRTQSEHGHLPHNTAGFHQLLPCRPQLMDQLVWQLYNTLPNNNRNSSRSNANHYTAWRLHIYIWPDLWTSWTDRNV